jgi:hypothetical protein
MYRFFSPFFITAMDVKGLSGKKVLYPAGIDILYRKARPVNLNVGKIGFTQESLR